MCSSSSWVVASVSLLTLPFLAPWTLRSCFPWSHHWALVPSSLSHGLTLVPPGTIPVLCASPSLPVSWVTGVSTLFGGPSGCLYWHDMTPWPRHFQSKNLLDFQPQRNQKWPWGILLRPPLRQSKRPLCTTSAEDTLCLRLLPAEWKHTDFPWRW